MTKILDFKAMVKTVETKHKIQIRDYTGLFGTSETESHFDKYIRLTGDSRPCRGEYPNMEGPAHSPWTIVRNGVRRSVSKEAYDADFKLIHEQYQRYKNWCKLNPEPEYLDYWHFLLEHHFNEDEVRNPCKQTFNMKEIIISNHPQWVKDITQKFYDEFKDHLDEDGAVTVRIKW